MTSSPAGAPGLARRLTTTDAVVIGLGSMIGAGVFAAFAPAAAAAGAGLLVGLAIAAVVAWCNATSSAQLAAQYPTSGGTYVFGRERLGEWPGFLAGWSFVVGKTTSCAAMALTFAAYAVPEPWQKPAAVAAVLALATVNLFGVTRTARLTKIIVSVVVIMLLAVVAVALRSAIGGPPEPTGADLLTEGWHGILQSAGILFFAFAGYARVATMGEEVANPARSIPRAITVALAGVLVLYGMLAVLLLVVLGPARLAASPAPMITAVTDAGAGWMVPLVQIGAAFASLGALLALLAGIGRTTLAMARNDDLPRWLSAVHPRSRVPHRAEIALAVAVIALVIAVDVRPAIGFSAFGVLLYYLVANIAAWTQTAPHRRYPRALQAVGALGCLVLVVALPWPSLAVGAAVLGVGTLYRLAARARRRRVPG